MNKPKRIDLNKTSFEANGKTYHIEYTLAKLRYTEKEKLEPLIRFGVTVEDCYKDWEKLYATGEAALSPVKFVHETMQTALKYIGAKERFLSVDNTSVVLDYCCLFCNTEDEDIREFSKKKNKQKKADWEAEGIAVLDFFFLAWIGLRNTPKSFLDLLKENQELVMPLNTDLKSLSRMRQAKQDSKDSKQPTPETSK